MIVKRSNITGKKIFTQGSGAEVDTVNELICHPEGTNVDALLLGANGFFSSKAKIVYFRDIASIGNDAIMITSEDSVATVTENSVKKYCADPLLLHKKLFTEEGNEVGKVSDIYFDTESGNITTFEISQGMLSDMKGGKKVLNFKHVSKVGDDTIVVAKGAENELEESNDSKGMEGLVSQAKEKSTEMTDQEDHPKKQHSEKRQQSKDKDALDMEDMQQFQSQRTMPHDNQRYHSVQAASQAQAGDEESHSQLKDTKRNVVNQIERIEDTVSDELDRLREKITKGE